MNFRHPWKIGTKLFENGVEKYFITKVRFNFFYQILLVGDDRITNNNLLVLSAALARLEIDNFIF
jgi:hypothetical protein